MSEEHPTGARRSLIVRGAKGTGLILLMLLAFVLADGWEGFGARATGARRARMEASPQWEDGHFVNPQPLINDLWGSLTGASDMSPDVSPSGSPAVLPLRRAALDLAPPSGLRVTWLGHSTTLVEIDGHRVLTDPVWSARVGPVDWAGPVRWFAPLIALAELPVPDAVVISHDHYDHLDHRTIRSMREWDTTFVVPLGVGAHLASWGVPEAKIVELDWWERTPIGDGLEIVATPARHASGRVLLDNDAKLWAGYALVGANHRVWYSGDTGLFPAMREIGSRLGPFDLTMIEVGQYHQAWPDWHLGPEQAVQAHQMVGGRVMLPVHWGLFALAYHAWTEPVERALAEGDRVGATLIAPRPGEPVEPMERPAVERWWPELEWRTGAEDPIVASQME